MPGTKYLTYINSHNSRNKPTIIGTIIIIPVLQMRKLEVPGFKSRQFGSRVCALDCDALLPLLRKGSLLEEA